MISKCIGIRSGSLYSHYKTKEAIMDAVIAYIRHHLCFSPPRQAEIAAMLVARTPQQVLESRCFYSNEDFDLKLFKALYMEMNYNEKAKRAIVEIWVEYRELMRHLLDSLVDLRAIPSQDTATLAEMWMCVSFSFSICFTHDIHTYRSQYGDVMRTLSGMACSGARPVEIGPVDLPAPGGDPLGSGQQGLSEGTRSRIGCAAFQLFCKQGFEQTTMVQIADQVGIRPSAIYRHFKSKQAILQSITQSTKAIHMNKYAELCDFLAAFPQERDVRSFVATMANSFVLGENSFQEAGYRLFLHEQYRNDDVKYYFLGTLNDDRKNVTNALVDLRTQGCMGGLDPYILSTILVFLQTTITIRQSVLGQSVSDTADFRLRAAALIGGVMLQGVDLKAGGINPQAPGL